MDALIFLSAAAAALLTHLSDASSICTPAKCSLHSPEIRPPFRIQDFHPRPCGAPGFNLFCKDNATMIHFPGYGNLAVQSISYAATTLDLVDPNNCVHQVFLNLNMSATPFRYYYLLKEYTYLNCSRKLGDPFMQVPCLSGSNHHVYILESVNSLPISCSVVRVVAMPFSYSPYLSDSSFGLKLMWAPIRRGKEEAEPGIGRQKCQHRKHVKVCAVAGTTMILVLVMLGMILFYVKVSEGLNEENVKGKNKTKQELKIDNEKLLG